MLIACAAFIPVFSQTDAPTQVAFKEDFEAGLRDRWKEVKFDKETAYSVIKDGTNSVLQAISDKAATGLAVEIRVPPTSRTELQWRWKIDRTPTGGSERQIRTFDHSARLFVAFRTRIGPPRTINYVWANTLQPNETFNHPKSNRARFIVLQSGDSRAGQWMPETRNLAADWKLLFGDSSPPEIVAIGLMTDSDGTKQMVTGWYDDLLLLNSQAPRPKR